MHPTKARPSLEACGIDVFALARDNGFDMDVVPADNQTGYLRHGAGGIIVYKFVNGCLPLWL